MIATMEKTTVATMTATLPTVTYDPDLRQITATVIVSAGESGLFHHAVPQICIPGSGPNDQPWTVKWTLVAADGISAFFGTPGVVLPLHSSDSPDSSQPPATLPPDLVVQQHTQDGAEASIEFINNVESANFFHYDLNVCINGCASPSVKARMIDPTIAVVPDPIT